MKITDSKLNTNSQVLPVSHSASSPKTESAASFLSPEEQLIEALKNNYQNINFDFIDFNNTDQIKQYAGSQHGINNVVISPELLKKMAADESLRTRVEGILNSLSGYQQSAVTEAYLKNKRLTGMGIVIDENGEASKWAAAEELSPKTESNFYDLSSKKSPYRLSSPEKKDTEFYATPYKYSQSHQMMRLANAKKVSSVRGLIASSQTEISKVKRLVSDPAEAAAIIGKIKSVIRSSNIKIARLHKEERIYQLERIAARRRKVKLEQQLSEKLRKKRVARKAQEHCQTASFDDVFGKPSPEDEKYRQINEQYSANVMTAAFVPSFSAAPAASSAPSAASPEITVSSVTAIDCSV